MVNIFDKQYAMIILIFSGYLLRQESEPLIWLGFPKGITAYSNGV